MSPFVLSLLALAALLAAADAHSNCAFMKFGRKGDRTAEGQTFKLPAGGVRFEFDDPCVSYYLACGVNATACNNDKNGDAPVFENIHGKDYVRCPDDGCPQGVVVQTMFECEYCEDCP